MPEMGGVRVLHKLVNWLIRYGSAFSLRLKVSSVIPGFHRASGSLFHSDRPAGNSLLSLCQIKIQIEIQFIELVARRLKIKKLNKQ